jgi:two-component system, OmpR family, response regulator
VNARSFQYRGDLAEAGLAEILYSIDRFQVPGVIQAERAGVVKDVYLKEGRIVHASSSDVADGLGDFLFRGGQITAEEHARMMRLRAEADRRLGELLVEEGLLTPGAVHDAIRQQVEAIVWSLFYWEEGAVTFSIGEFPHGGGRVKIDLPMRQVILQGIRRAPNARTLVGRLGKKETVFAPSWEVETLIALGLDGDEHALLRLVDGRRTLYQVCTEGPFSAAENAKMLYAFQVLRLIRRGAVEDNAAGEPPREGPVKVRLKTAGDRFSGDDQSS